MPVSLFSVSSRRQWIRQSVAAGLGTAWTWQGASGAESDGEVWALLSDTHIAGDPAFEARGAVVSSHLERSVKQVLGVGVKPHGVLVNGDCAYKNGQAEDYVQFMRCLAPLQEERVQVHCTMGNHDDRKAFQAATSQPGVEPLLADKHVTVLSSARANWVLLDSLVAVDSTPGELGAGQLGWLRRTLGKLAQRPTFVMVHHNPQGTVADGKKPSGLVDSGALMEVLRAFPMVKALFYGHTHKWEALPPQDGNPWLINLPPAAYAFDPARPSGWVLARVSNEVLSLELRSLNPNHAQHRQRVEIALG